MLASELFATAHSARCTGKYECHWCGGACTQDHFHDDLPPVPFQKSRSTAKRPSNPYICTGCWLYRRKRVSVQYLHGSYKDRQSLPDHSWWLTDDNVRVISPIDHHSLYENLLFPPLRFSVSLLRQEKVNLLQLAEVNDFQEITADTYLKFTLDNRVLTYTIYELEEALKHGPDGKMPGVRALLDHLGPYAISVDIKEEKRGRGRPKASSENKENPTRKIINKAY